MKTLMVLVQEVSIHSKIAFKSWLLWRLLRLSLSEARLHILAPYLRTSFGDCRIWRFWIETPQVTGVRNRQLPMSLNTPVRDGRETTDCPSLSLGGQTWQKEQTSFIRIAAL